ncbi:MAG TPA: hypothetical protein VNM14_07520 [Planctomycetota bacterium]|jgi:hypothetical protein|nr:hypothetical protein [Planctomycetota bacterium]
MIPIVLQTPEPASSAKGLVAILGLLGLLVVLLFVGRKRRAAAAGVTPEEARRELDRLGREGKRDVWTEAHLGAFFSWCKAYAILVAISFSLIVFGSRKPQNEESRPALDRGTSQVFGVLLGAEGIGLWLAARGISRGNDGARWAATGLLTLLSLTAVGAGIFWSGPQAGTTRLSNLMIHGCVAAYAAAGATFLLLPRCARLCTTEYREGARGIEGPQVQAALNLARTRSPFTWAPIGLMIGLFILQEVVKR